MSENEIKEKLVDLCKSFATHMLKGNGEFYPFAYAMIADYSIGVVEPDENDNLTAVEILDNLIKVFYDVKDRFGFIAACICVDVFVQHEKVKREALEIRLHLQNNVPVNIYIPYYFHDDSLYFRESYELEGSFKLF